MQKWRNCAIISFLSRKIRYAKNPRGGEKRVTEVILRDGDSLDRALRRFKRMVQRAGVFSELRRKKYYEKPSEEKKRKSAAAERRRRRQRARQS